MWLLYLVLSINTVYSNEKAPRATYTKPRIKTVQDIPFLYLDVLKSLNRHSPHTLYLSENTSTICSLLNTLLVDIDRMDKKRPSWPPPQNPNTFLGEIQTILYKNGAVSLDTTGTYLDKDDDAIRDQIEILFNLEDPWRKFPDPCDMDALLYTKEIECNIKISYPILIDAIIQKCHPSVAIEVYELSVGKDKKQKHIIVRVPKHLEDLFEKTLCITNENTIAVS